MRKIVIGMDTGLAGTDACLFYEVPVTLTEEELNDLAWQCGKNHAEMYGTYPREEYDDIDEEDEDSYSDNIEGWWEEYDPKKHDGHTVGGTPEWQDY